MTIGFDSCTSPTSTATCPTTSGYGRQRRSWFSISLAAFPALFALNSRNLGVVVAFALFSIAVMAFWLVIADGHRYFQEKSLNIATFLEGHVLGREVAKELGKAAEARVEKPGLSIRTARYVLVGVTALLWLVIEYVAWRGWLPGSTK